MKVIQDGTIIKGSGNVFADLGFPPEEATNLHRRSQIMIALRSFIEKRGLTQAEAAVQLKSAPMDISNLIRGKINRLPLDTLVEMARHLG